MRTFFESIGIVLSLVIITITTLALLYLSYVLAIGFIIIALTYITYSFINIAKKSN
jgi:hypothetical protein